MNAMLRILASYLLIQQSCEDRPADGTSLSIRWARKAGRHRPQGPLPRGAGQPLASPSTASERPPWPRAAPHPLAKASTADTWSRSRCVRGWLRESSPMLFTARSSSLSSLTELPVPISTRPLAMTWPIAGGRRGSAGDSGGPAPPGPGGCALCPHQGAALSLGPRRAVQVWQP